MSPGQAFFLGENQVTSWVQSLRAGGWSIHGPIRRDTGQVAFCDLGSEGVPDLTLDTSRSSVRDLWMPQTEVLFRCHLRASGVRLEPEPRLLKPRVAFGLTPADAAAIRRVTSVFRRGVRPDPLGVEAENLALVVLLPQAVSARAAAIALDSPTAHTREAADIALTPVTGGLVAQVFTELGNRVWSHCPGADAPTAGQVQKAEALWAALEEHKRPQRTDRLAGSARDIWDSEVFVREAQRCLGCGICTYLCPACHCFDILDEKTGPVVTRYRCWDSCQFAHFTLHASRHNPRPDQAARLRQRVLHKFLYMPQEFGVVGCTGCGRCVDLCPVGISIFDVLEQLAASATRVVNEA